MLAKGHITVGLAAYTGGTMLLMSKVPTYNPSVLMIGMGLAGTILGSVLPDIDSPNSVIGQRVPIISHAISRIFGHRTATHNLFFILFWFALAHNTGQHGLWALAWGVLIHILSDSFSRQGVPWFYPIINKRIRISGPFGIKGYRVRERNKKSRIFLFALIIIVALLAMKYF